MAEPHACKIVIVDDHQIFADVLKSSLKKTDTLQVVGVFNTTEDYFSALKTIAPDIVLMDINFKHSSMNGIEATRETLKENPNIKVVALSSHDDIYTVKKMFEAGACAYFTKDLSLATLLAALEKVCKGETYISPTVTEYYTINNLINEEAIPMTLKDFSDQEFSIMEHAASGKTDKEIAQIMQLTDRIVEYEKSKVYKKLKVRNAAEMVQVAFRLGLLK